MRGNADIQLREVRKWHLWLEMFDDQAAFFRAFLRELSTDGPRPNGIVDADCNVVPTA